MIKKLKIALVCWVTLFCGAVHGASQKSLDQARLAIVSENFSDALVIYAPLAKSTTNPQIVAEYAYALALAGIYDLSLIQLDRVWQMGKNSSEVNYFAAQVFNLMGYNDIVVELLKINDNSLAPSWIAKQAPSFLQKYKASGAVLVIKNEEEFLQTLEKANTLADRSYYFQSIALFHQIVGVYPDEYFPYVYYSITLEKAGATTKALQMVDKAISVIGNNPEDLEKKQLLQERKNELQARLSTAPGFLSLPQSSVISPPRIIFYVGGQASSIYSSLNFRTGYLFSDNKYNINVDFGLFSDTAMTDPFATSIGFSAYRRLLVNSRESQNQVFLVGGVGIQKIQNKNVSPNLTFGVSVVSNKRLSLDVLYNIYSEKVRTFLIGETFYF
jgi:tetratricopeptide (TPR) repeat protein